MFRNEFLILIWRCFRGLHPFSYERYMFLQWKIKVVLKAYKWLEFKYLNNLDFRISLYIFDYRYQKSYCLTFLRNLFINFYFFDKTEVRDNLGFTWISLSDFLSQFFYNRNIISWFFSDIEFFICSWCLIFFPWVPKKRYESIRNFRLSDFFSQTLYIKDKSLLKNWTQYFKIFTSY